MISKIFSKHKIIKLLVNLVCDVTIVVQSSLCLKIEKSFQRAI